MKRWMSLLLALLMVLGIGTVALAEGEESVIGTMEGNVYTNEAFDFVIELPDNWQVMTDAEIASSMGYGSLYGSREGLLRVLERRSYVCALIASKENAAGYTILFNVEDLKDRHSMSEEDYYALHHDTIEESMLKAGFTDLEEARGLLVGQRQIGHRLSGSIRHDELALFQKRTHRAVDQRAGVGQAIAARSDFAIDGHRLGRALGHLQHGQHLVGRSLGGIHRDEQRSRFVGCRNELTGIFHTQVT